MDVEAATSGMAEAHECECQECGSHFFILHLAENISDSFAECGTGGCGYTISFAELLDDSV